MNAKILSCLLAIVSLALPLRALEPWMDDIRNYRSEVVLVAPTGYSIHASPTAGAPATGTVPGPARVAVSGFIEAGGKRYYMTSESRQAWLDNQTPPVWISTGGDEQLPALPRLIKRGPAEDPDSGEMVTVEAYEETVPIEAEVRWPVAAAVAQKSFPAALLATSTDGSGNTIAEFQLFMNANANPSGYPFAEPSYRELTSGKENPSVRLYSRPGSTNFRLVVPDQSAIASLLQPGLVFLAGFSDGKLVRLSLGGDAWSEWAPISRLGAPAFQNDGKLAFGFSATGMKRSDPAIRVVPDRIGGADYTQYALIAKMGAPFGDNDVPEEFQHSWTLHIEGDLTTTVLAPLYDGRGAPGMIELEGLELDAPLPASNAENISEERFAAFRYSLPTKTDPGLFGQGWKSILETKLGDVPASQRVPETDGGEF